MRHYPALPGGYAIFADDIRQEVMGKVTLVGTYFTELVVRGEPPFLIPQLSIMVVYRDDPAALPKDVTFRVLHERPEQEDEVLWEVNLTLPKPEEDQLAPKLSSDPHARRMIELRAFPRFVPFAFAEEGQISVRAFAGDDEVRIGTLLLRILPLDASGVDETPPA